MENAPLISVILPAYNHAQYIGAAVNSIARQDYPEFEIIVIDDGSTDGTAQAAEVALRQGGRPYQLLSQDNRGAYAALNRGMETAHGSYLSILNSDDLYLPGRLTRLHSALVSSGKRFAFSKVAHIDAIGYPHPYQKNYLRQLEQARQFPAFTFELLRHNIAATSGNFFFHRTIYEEVGGFSDLAACHDWDYLLRVLLVEDPLFVDEILLQYRIHAGGALQAQTQRVNAEIEQIMLNYLTRVGAAKNPLAPGPARWGAAWNEFSQNHLERIRALPRVRTALDRMHSPRASGLASEQPPTVRKPSRETVEDMDKNVDLDLTRISLDIPEIARDEKTGLRLLIILPWMVMGGAERFTLNLIDQLGKRGWQVSIVCTAPSDHEWRAEFEKHTQDIFILPDSLPIKEYPAYLRYLIELRQFDAVLVQGSIEGYRLLPAIRQMFPQMPILDYLHFVTPDWMDGGFPRLSVLYRDAIDQTITSCQQVKDWMTGQDVEESRLMVCPIGVDSQIWHPDEGNRKRVRSQLGIGTEEVLLVYAARLEAQKQPMVFAETVRQLSAEGVSFRAICAGDGSLRPELERFIAEHGLQHTVNVAGAVPAASMPGLLAAADIFFLPSQNEGISSAFYEAMSCGLPVIGTDVGGQAELVTPECGILIPSLPEAEQPAAFAAALKPLILDQARRAAMGTAGRARILSSFTLDHMGERMHSVLAESMDLKRKGLLPPRTLPPEESLQRETGHIIEYLQARQEWHSLNQQHAALYRKYAALEGPKPPSYWFYLWIRQLFLPLLAPKENRPMGNIVISIRERVKRLMKINE